MVWALRKGSPVKVVPAISGAVDDKGGNLPQPLSPSQGCPVPTIDQIPPIIIFYDENRTFIQGVLEFITGPLPNGVESFRFRPQKTYYEIFGWF